MEYIGRYQVVRELGHGAMGVVYLAQHPAMDRMVAIKTFRPPDGDDADLENRERLLAEANRAGSLDHPNIVKIYDVDDSGESPYIVMEYVDGPTLDQLLATAPPDADLSISILRQAAEALDYAHSQGIIHRDVKPANLMLDSKNTVKVTDFGIAKRAGASTRTISRFMGTPQYMSPEQLEGRPDIDGRTDQFALATIAYQLVTGRKPFEADTVTALSHLIANKSPEPPSHVNRNLGRQVDAVISKALSKSRDRRYGSCTEFTDALELALMAPARRSPAWAPLVAAFALLAALVGAGIYFHWFGGETSEAIRLNPPAATLHASDSVQFRAVDANGSPATVRWSISPGIGEVSETGVYQAPGDITKEEVVTLSAVSTTGNGRAVAELRLEPPFGLPVPSPPSLPPPVAITPQTARLVPGQSVQFRAPEPGVRWSISPNVGTISPRGVYRSPQQNPVDQTVIVTATGADGSTEGTAQILLRGMPVETPRYSLRVYARDTPLRPGTAADPGESDFWVGDIYCLVQTSGIGKNAKLELVWYKDGQQADVSPFSPPGPAGLRVTYENKPEPGKYLVRLLVNGKATTAEASFVVAAPKQ